MSHVVTIASKVRDPNAVAAACRRLGLAEPVTGTAQLFSAEATGLIVRLPDWVYPVVIDTATGTVAFDHYNEAWGSQVQLDKFLQMYAVEVTKLEARKQGYLVNEQTLQDGSIKLRLTGGAG